MKESTDVTLAVYTERLDSYISGQAELNKTLGKSLEKINSEIAELKDWKQRVHGVKAGSLAIGVLMFHTVLLLGAMTGLVSWTNSR
tara:strand:+ start:380 stop:637 length:258 start_codon:yes stop_codon:yes gene_type:complete